MDNPRLDVVGCNQEELRIALQLCLLRHKSITHWCETEPRLEMLGQCAAMRPHAKRLILFWTEPTPYAALGPVHRLLGGDDVDTLTNMLWSWLKTQHTALLKAGVSVVGHGSDTHEKLGFRIWNDTWGHVEIKPDASSDIWQGAAQIEFCYALVGK